MASDAVVVPPPLRRNRDFLLLWSGQAVSSLGSQLSLVAYPLLILALTHSPAKAGIAGFARDLPVGLLALPAGALADRVNRRALMVAGDVARGAALTGLGVAVLAGRVPFGVIVAVGAVDGAGFVVSYVTERGVLRALVPAEQLGEAVARNESRIFGAMLAGPPLGGVLFGLARSIPFLADAASYAVSAATKLLIRAPFQEAREEPEPYGHVLEGLGWLWRRPFFRLVSLLFACSNPVLSGLLLLVVLLAKQHGASSAEVGAMLGIAAAGGLFGSLLAPAVQRRASPHAVLVAENWTLVAAIPLLLVVPDPLLIGVVVALAVLITPATNAIVVSLRVAAAPDRLQGRVQAASSLISFSGGWMGPLAVGLLDQGAGSTATILALTGWMLVLALWVSASRTFRVSSSAVAADSAAAPSAGSAAG